MCRRKLLAQAVLAVAGLAVASLASAEPATGRAVSGSLTSAIAPAAGSEAGATIKTPSPADIDALLARGGFQPLEAETLRSALSTRTLSLEGLRSLIMTREEQVRTRGVASPLEGALTVMTPNVDSIGDRRGGLRTTGARSSQRAGGELRIDNLPGDVVNPGGPADFLGGPSNCCVAHPTPGCDNAACQTIVCAADPFCCNVQWDGLCANAANAMCAICMGAAPPNDNCEDAINMVVGDTVTGTTNDATFEPIPTPSCAPGANVVSPGVWYTMTGTGNQITLSTCPALGGSANYDTKISVYCGDCTSEVFCAGGNDDSCSTPGDPFKSTVTWCSAPGTVYSILVHGFFAQGNFTMVSSDGPPCSNPPVCAPCIVNCPPGGIAENEPNCGLPTDSVNGGCNYPVVITPPPGDCGVVHFTPGCSDPTCSAAVCAVDPFCCSVFWDGICVGEAQTLCGEVAFLLTPIACDQTVCGSGAWNPAIGFRDTDWFEFTLDEAATVSWTVTAEFSGNGFFLTPTCPPTITDVQTFVPCVTNTMTSACARAPGTYWGFVAPLFADAVVCPREYNVTLGCDPICDGAGGCGPCDVFALLQLLVPPGRQDVISSHPCFGAPVPPSPSESCCETVNAIIDILPGVVDGDHARLDFTHPCFVP
jgi:hypothetical protein